MDVDSIFVLVLLVGTIALVLCPPFWLLLEHRWRQMMGRRSAHARFWQGRQYGLGGCVDLSVDLGDPWVNAGLRSPQRTDEAATSHFNYLWLNYGPKGPPII